MSTTAATDSKHRRRFSLGRLLHLRSISSSDATSPPAADASKASKRLSVIEPGVGSYPKQAANGTTRSIPPQWSPPAASAPPKTSIALDIPSPPGMTRLPSASTGSSYPVTPVQLPGTVTSGSPFPAVVVSADTDHTIRPETAAVAVGVAGVAAATTVLSDDVVNAVQNIGNGQPADKSGEDDSGLVSVVKEITSYANGDGKPIIDQAMQAVEGVVSQVQAQTSTASQILAPIEQAVEATGVVQIVKNGLDGFMEDLPFIMKGLDEVAKLHPFIGAVVIVFKAAYTMEMTRRQNDKRIITLYVAMKDMIGILVQLKDVKDIQAVGPGGLTIEARMQKSTAEATEDIKKCAADCDMYHKKSMLVKVLKGQLWQSKLEGWVTKFSDRKTEFQFNLSIHTANAVEHVQTTTDSMDRKLDAMQETLLKLLRESVPPAEQELARRIEEKGGVEAVKNNDDVLRKLLDEENTRIDKVQAQAKSDDTIRGHSTKTDPRSTYTVINLKEELEEDWDTALAKNMKTFEGKFAIQHRQIKEEFDNAIEQGTKRVIDELNRGPHELIVHPEIRAIWKDMGWRLNVKSRLFVMTIRDHLSEVSSDEKTDADSTSAKFSGHDHGEERNMDKWAFHFISVKYLQSIMEAFDDDGTGYITINEVNSFVNALPKGISWSLPRWIAYWAIGWQQASLNYCKKILSFFAHMHELRAHVLPINRFGVDYYLQKVWKVGIELCIPLTQRKYLRHLPDWLEEKFSEFVQHEETRILDNLNDVQYTLDAPETVAIVTGRGRIEKNIFALLYLLLKRDFEIFEHAKTEKLDRDELWDAADNILRVYTAVMDRYKDLRTLFTQQKVELDKQFQVYACGIYEYIHDDGALFSSSNLVNPTTFRKSLHSGEESDDHSEPEHWDPNVNPLTYDLDSKHPFACEVYETSPEQPSEADVKAGTPLQLILGQWNGFVYNYEVSSYPLYFMYSFYIHASTQEGQDFEASGSLLGTPYSVKGKCALDGHGNTTITLVKQHSDKYDSEYLQGILLPDGSLVGTQGSEEDPTKHTNRFILKRTSAELMCHRPPPHEFETNKARALWKFAAHAIRYQVSKEHWSWNYFARRRDLRESFIKSQFRITAYGRPLNPGEKEVRRVARQNVTSLDADFYHSIYEYRQRTVPNHVLQRCDSCFHTIGAGIRTMCLECLPAKDAFYKSVNLCDHPDCLASTIPVHQKAGLTKPHTPDHDVLKLRSVLQLSEHPHLYQRAKKALKACRELFEDRSTPVVNQHIKMASESALPDSIPTEPTTAAPSAVSPPHHELARSKTENGIASGEISHSLLNHELTRSRTFTTREISAKEDDGRQGEVQRKEKGSKRARHGKFGFGAAREPRGAARFSNFERHAAEAALDMDIPPSDMNRKKVCSVCRKGVQQPCWICVDCYHQGVGSFICDACEEKLQLRCVKCENTYRQPSWYFGTREEDTFMCTKCDTQAHKSPSTIIREKQHCYVHALVRCTAPRQAPLSTEERIGKVEDKMLQLDSKVSQLDGKMSQLDGKVSQLDGKVSGLDAKVSQMDTRVTQLHTKLSRLEDTLVRVEAALGTVLSRLQGQDTMIPAQ